VLPGGEHAPQRPDRQGEAGPHQPARDETLHAGEPDTDRDGHHTEDERHHADEPQLGECAFGGLAAKLGSERLFGAKPFGLNLSPLHVHPGAVAIERFLERRHDDAREARFELTERAASWQRTGDIRTRPAPEPTRHLRQAIDRIEHLHPLSDTHRPSLRTRRLRCKPSVSTADGRRFAYGLA
jgi:hypothetical protein